MAVPSRHSWRVGHTELGTNELRSYATLVWIGQAMVIGYACIAAGNSAAIAVVPPTNTHRYG